jgi:hypothetical protein
MYVLWLYITAEYIKKQINNPLSIIELIIVQNG